MLKNRNVIHVLIIQQLFHYFDSPNVIGQQGAQEHERKRGMDKHI
ncbi:hypothetical protein NEIFLAOT_01165 [Neisseria flavescens NRL30031/H210]|uniref:Uncharacterized protein n=1 Tax=Neisseria flavescens NRL30031/H210 TaxID=546264 RepID=C0EMJ4_NEIFL|nr:hypothetical protein NEIFLAOT_01165 [Neisseria flavescens NRL30031/H210]